MKKQLLFLNLFLLISTLSFAQISITKKDGTPINDGDVFTYNSIEEANAKLVFYVDNNTSNPVNLKVTFNDITNADGNDMQFCYGTTCYFNVTEGTQYPAVGDDDVIIAANSNLQSNGNYFWNKVDGSDVIDYAIEFTDANSDFSLSITYRFDQNFINVNEFNQIPVDVFPSVANETINVRVKENVDLNIFDLSGRLIRTEAISAGVETLNVSDLTPQTYILKLSNKEGKVSTRKVVIK
ncbi:T9SS type A sorting domain-containing protein [Aureivirga marina]|uniref:T9SS type A sorting domain-containing protein n=1 Tax=Aureivirga marina TaxID=1182451 RepID=UPI0018C9A067|nr:T9SS type A sorting domain-containing protein [Aureivirga marina]